MQLIQPAPMIINNTIVQVPASVHSAVKELQNVITELRKEAKDTADTVRKDMTKQNTDLQQQLEKQREQERHAHEMKEMADRMKVMELQKEDAKYKALEKLLEEQLKQAEKTQNAALIDSLRAQIKERPAPQVWPGWPGWPGPYGNPYGPFSATVAKPCATCGGVTRSFTHVAGGIYQCTTCFRNS